VSEKVVEGAGQREKVEVSLEVVQELLREIVRLWELERVKELGRMNDRGIEKVRFSKGIGVGTRVGEYEGKREGEKEDEKARVGEREEEREG
jgi:CRISPR/Cas system CSM-associated protein Csm3 (group 7 of RAMP superfamily)